MRSFVTVTAMLLATPVFAGVVIIAGLLGIPNRPGGLYDRVPRLWSRLALRMAGARLEVHDAERALPGPPRVFASNHVSWYDIFALLAVLPRCCFVAKAELFRIPLFGRAARIAGTIPIQRDNRKAAFQSYEEAARGIRDGSSVVVCPEGTRGDSYGLRPFKKGPFVLAIAAQAPVVPVAVFGAREIQPRGSFRIRSGTIHLHFLEPIPTEGMDYEDRDRLAAECWIRIADALREHHGVESGSPPRERVRKAESVTAARTLSHQGDDTSLLPMGQ